MDERPTEEVRSAGDDTAPPHLRPHCAPASRTGHVPCTAATLAEHADHVEHTAAVGGYVHPVTGERRHLAELERRQWAASAAALREAALTMEHA